MNIEILLLPTQLFHELPNVKKVILYEHPKYFTKFEYHPLKLLYHRASMKYYESFLRKKKVKVTYIEYKDDLPGSMNVNFFEVGDREIDTELLSKGYEQLQSPYFYTSGLHKEYCLENPNLLVGNKTNMNSFYVWCRKHTGLLMNEGKPVGGKWTFDTENRDPFSKDINDTILPQYNLKYKRLINSSIKYILHNFPHVINYEPLTFESLYLPINHEEARLHLSIFLKERLCNFGQYEDAQDEKVLIGYHSVLSPIINIGLLTPKQVIDEALLYQDKVQMNNLEGFIRQLFWREYVYLCYKYYDWDELIIKGTFINQNRKLHSSWYSGLTEKAPSGFTFIDKIISKTRKYAYNHHIERLMYLSNLMLISGISAHDMNKWFMIHYLDAYEWVMIPNVYGMASHHVNLIMKRPYFSSSAYVSKMGRLKKTEVIKLGETEYKWPVVWDALYYNFIAENHEYLSHNYATANFVANWKKKAKKDQEEIKRIAQEYSSYF